MRVIYIIYEITRDGLGGLGALYLVVVRTAATAPIAEIAARILNSARITRMRIVLGSYGSPKCIMYNIV